MLSGGRLAGALRLLREPSHCCYCAGLWALVADRWGNKEDNGLGLGDRCSHRMDITAGRLAWGFWGDSLYLLAGGVGQNRATQVLKGIQRPRRLTLGFYNRGFDAGAL